MIDDLDRVIKFFDNVCKGIEGIKDKYMQIIIETESKNEKVENVLKSWTHAIKTLIEEKYEEVFNEKYDEELFESRTKLWLTKYKSSQELALNVKLLFKSLNNLKTTIKNKIISSDPLCYNNLTDSLINKSKAKK
jgi:hypothetical protein